MKDCCIERKLNEITARIAALEAVVHSCCTKVYPKQDDSVVPGQMKLWEVTCTSGNDVTPCETNP